MAGKGVVDGVGPRMLDVAMPDYAIRGSEVHDSGARDVIDSDILDKEVWGRICIAVDENAGRVAIVYALGSGALDL